MALISKGSERDARYARIAPVCRLLWVAFRVLAYISGILVGLLGVIAVILIFVNVTAEEMLFTPYMKVMENGMFDVSLGNGARVIVDSSVGTASIKGTVYAGLFTLMAGLAVCMPVFHFLSKLMKNVGAGKVLSEENAACVNYIGMAIMLGNPFVLLVQRFFNYKLISIFIKNVEVKFDFGIDLFGFILGLLIILIGTIYGYACNLHREETALVVRDSR